jgi:hypothetical protein
LGAVLTDGGEHKTRIVILNPPQKSAVSVEAGLLRQKFPNCASEIMEARQLKKYFLLQETTQPLCIVSYVLFASSLPCASPPPWPSIFSHYSFWVHQLVNRDGQQLLAHAMASDFSVTWQCLSKRTIVFFLLRIKLHAHLIINYNLL